MVKTHKAGCFGFGMGIFGFLAFLPRPGFGETLPLLLFFRQKIRKEKNEDKKNLRSSLSSC